MRSTNLCLGARQVAAKPHRVFAELAADPVDGVFDPPRVAELAVEQARRVGGAAVEQVIGTDPDQTEPGEAVGLGGEQAGRDV